MDSYTYKCEKLSGVFRKPESLQTNCSANDLLPTDTTNANTCPACGGIQHDQSRSRLWSQIRMKRRRWSLNCCNQRQIQKAHQGLDWRSLLRDQIIMGLHQLHARYIHARLHHQTASMIQARFPNQTATLPPSPATEAIRQRSSTSYRTRHISATNKRLNKTCPASCR